MEGIYECEALTGVEEIEVVHAYKLTDSDFISESNRNIIHTITLKDQEPEQALITYSNTTMIYLNGVHFYELSGSNVFIITKDDLVYAFGENSGGCLGLGHNNPIKELKIIGSLCDKGIVEFSHGFNHVIARTNSDEIYCWGDCNILQPKNISSNRSTKKPELNKFLSEKIIIDICCGFKHSLALTQLREVYGWGYNKHGQLGIGGDCDFQLTPMKVNGFNDEKVSAISCGSYHSLALTESGLVFSWGSNGRGQLGIGHTRNSIKPQLINNRSNVFIKKIRCGRFHSLLLSNDGDIYAFGSNDYGQLGTKESHDSMSGRLELRSEMKSDRNLPVKINHDAKFVDISTHFNYDISIALSSNCAYFIWGKCGEEIICYPRETKFKSLLDIFAFYFGITNRLIHISNNKCRDSIFKEKLVYEKEFSEICLIASGSFGIVCKAMKKNEEGIYAIKKIPLSEDQVDIAIREIKIMSSFDNDYTVKCYDAWIEENYFVSNFFKKHEKSGIESTHLVFDYHRQLLLHIQLELCSKTLKEIIEQLNEELNQKQTQTLTPIGYYICSELFREVLESVNYLHKQNIIHRDLKPENILITEGQNGRFVKIADFGLATIHEFEGQSHTKYKGTRKYSAPEVLNSRRYDTKADVYSLGVVVAELFNININETFYLGIDSLLKDKYKNLLETIDKMMSSRKDFRPNCDQILAEVDTWALSLTKLKLVENLKFLRSKILPKSFHSFFIQTKFDELDEVFDTSY